MTATDVMDLSSCTQYRQALRAHVPRSIHATAVLLIALIGAAVTWMTLTRVNLVVLGEGRVRTVSDPEIQADDYAREISSERDGRVIEVAVDVGDKVSANAVLVRLDTAQLDIQIDKLKQTIRAGSRKLQQFDRFEELLTCRFAAARAKAQAELTDVMAQFDVARRTQAADVQLAEAALAEARDKADRCQSLAARGVRSQRQLVEAQVRLKEAEERLHKAQIPRNEQKAGVFRQALELAHREYEVEQQKLNVERTTVQDEIDTAAFDLERLELEHRQSVARTPTDCIITKVDVRVGDMVKAGKIGVTIASQHGFEFEVEVHSADVAHLRPGMPARIKLDAFDYQKYGTLPGTVRFVAPDSTLKPIGSGRQAAVYSVKVALSADALGRAQNRGQIKLGMTGRAEIVTDRESILLILVRKMRQTISFS